MGTQLTITVQWLAAMKRAGKLAYVDSSWLLLTDDVETATLSLLLAAFVWDGDVWCYLHKHKGVLRQVERSASYVAENQYLQPERGTFGLYKSKTVSMTVLIGHPIFLRRLVNSPSVPPQHSGTDEMASVALR